MGLSNKQLVFIEEYLKCWNATEAAIRAGYKAKTRQRASEIGYQLLQKTPVSEAIQDRIAELKMSSDEVLIRLTEQARADIGDFVDIVGRSVVAKSQAQIQSKTHLIRKIKETKEGIELELYDAQAALVQLGRANGIFVDKIAPTDPAGENEYASGTRDELASLLAGLVARAREAGNPKPTESNPD